MIPIFNLFIYLLYLFNQAQEIASDILLINNLPEKSQTFYTIMTENKRIKRDQLLQISSVTDQMTCEQDVFSKLSSCLDLEDCKTLSSCLESIYCPLNVKHFGGLILNLLRLLGINHCYSNDINPSCPHERQLLILQTLFSKWNQNKDNDYCSHIINFMNEIKKEILFQCPLNFQQVETFLENYSCPSTFKTYNNNNEQLNIINRDLLKTRLLSSNINNPLEASSTKIPALITYRDEDNEIKFVSTHNKLMNTSEQTVHVNDHQYYNVSYVIPKSESTPIYFVPDDNRHSLIRELINRHRTALSINLKFEFPFYGHIVKKVLIATGGFIYTGDLLMSAIVDSTQYIAPFMANFDASIGKNETEIRYYDNGTHFICTWKKIYLQDQQEAGPFTFQAILQNNGNIYFNYVQMPKVNISDVAHRHCSGLSDAYVSQHATSSNIIRVITLYNKIDLDKSKLTNGVSVVLTMDQTCNTFTDCSSCLANRGRRYNCSWCDDLHRCSDGYDRARHQWIQTQCHHFALVDTCQSNMEEAYDPTYFLSQPSLPSMIQFERRKQTPAPTFLHHSALQTFRTILVTILISVLIVALVALSVTYVYAYRNPTSPVGMWLLEHRPSLYIARFRRADNSL